MRKRHTDAGLIDEVLVLRRHPGGSGRLRQRRYGRWPLLASGLAKMSHEELLELVIGSAWTPRRTRMLVSHLRGRSTSLTAAREGAAQLVWQVAHSPHLRRRDLSQLAFLPWQGLGLFMADQDAALTALLAHPLADEELAVEAVLSLRSQNRPGQHTVDFGRHLAPIALHLRSREEHVTSLAKAVWPTLRQLEELVAEDEERAPVLLKIGPAWVGSTAELLGTVRAICDGG